MNIHHSAVLAVIVAACPIGSHAETAPATTSSGTYLLYAGTLVTDASSNKWIVEGDKAYYAHDYRAAMSFYRRSVEDDNPTTRASAQNRIGILFERALGVPQDYGEALKWFEQSAELGNGFAQANIGDYNFYGIGRKRDLVEAMRWYRKAAEKNVPLGINQLAFGYLQGLGVVRNVEEAKRLYRQGVHPQNPNAAHQLGWIYGHVEPLDYGQALEWYKKAAEHGHATAMNNIGYLYEKGLGVKLDYAIAVQWYTKAAQFEEPRALFHLGTLSESGLGLPKDMSKARALMERAARAGDREAAEWLGRQGRGIRFVFAAALVGIALYYLIKVRGKAKPRE